MLASVCLSLCQSVRAFFPSHWESERVADTRRGEHNTSAQTNRIWLASMKNERKKFIKFVSIWTRAHCVCPSAHRNRRWRSMMINRNSICCTHELNVSLLLSNRMRIAINLNFHGIFVATGSPAPGWGWYTIFQEKQSKNEQWAISIFLHELHIYLLIVCNGSRTRRCHQDRFQVKASHWWSTPITLIFMQMQRRIQCEHFKCSHKNEINCCQNVQREKEKRLRGEDRVREVNFYGMQLEIDVLLMQVNATSIRNGDCAATFDHQMWKNRPFGRSFR